MINFIILLRVTNLIQKAKNNSAFSSLIKDSFVYTAVQLLNKVIPFLLLPLIVKLVSTQEYGTYALFLATETAILPFLSLNTDGSLNRHFFNDELDYKSYLTTIFLLIFGTTLIFFFLSFLIPVAWVSYSGLSINVFRWCIWSGFMSTMTSSILILFRNLKKKLLYALFLIFNSALLFGCMWFFVTTTHSSEGLIAAKVSVTCLFVIVGLLLIIKLGYLGINLKREYIYKALRYSLPTIPHSFSAFIFIASDRYVINAYLTKADVGIYSAIAQVAAVVSILAGTFNTAWIPWIFEHLNKKTAASNLSIVKISYILKAIFLIFGFFVMGIFPLVIKFLFPISYASHTNIAIYMVLGYCFQALYFIVAPYIYYTEKTQYTSIASILAACSNLLLNIFLVPRYGILGAAIASSTSWFILYIFTFMVSAKLYKMPWFLWSK